MRNVSRIRVSFHSIVILLLVLVVLVLIVIIVVIAVIMVIISYCYSVILWRTFCEYT